MFKGKSITSPPKNDGGNPFLDARREWVERYGPYIAQARNWRLAAILALLVSMILAVGSVYSATRPKYTPFIVEVNKLGDAIAVAPADPATKADPRVVRAELAAWIVQVRSITSDPTAERAALLHAYAFCAPAAVSFLNDYFRDHSPFGAARTVAVSVDSVLPTSPQAVELQWTEYERDPQGRMTETTHWVASIATVIDPPHDEKTILANPIGLYITSINWTQHV